MKPIVIKVDDNEISLKKALKEAKMARLKGQKIAFDLRGIKDRKRKSEIIYMLSVM